VNEDRATSEYARAGVAYDVLDAGKRRALAAAATSVRFPETRDASFDPRSFGEPASVVTVGGRTLATVLECLGTKSVIAHDLEVATGEDRYRAIGYDTVAAIVNDCICVGALPLVVHAYVATGSAAFYDGSRHASLVAGFLDGCRDARAAWGGGESPTLAGLIVPDGVDLAGCTVGIVPEGQRPIFGDALRAGDEIVLVASSGLHQNGASLARVVAAGCEAGLGTALPSGRTLGDALLDPGVIYVRFVEELLASALEVHYLSHLTGHGLRKLMRANRDLTYRMTTLPEVPEVLAFLAARAGMTEEDAYGTFNMGAGFAAVVAAGDGARTVEVARAAGHDAVLAGTVEAGPRRVLLEPLGVVYESTSLELR
jgi:phosphoribosylformylglycinamidine cyclo-ligase